MREWRTAHNSSEIPCPGNQNTVKLWLKDNISRLSRRKRQGSSNPRTEGLSKNREGESLLKVVPVVTFHQNEDISPKQFGLVESAFSDKSSHIGL